MTTKSEKDRAKQIQDKCQTLLDEMLRDEDNKYCVDCDTKGPRWASWNLGVFLCIRCAGIHRKLGVHISRVKSVNLDTWTPEQVVSLQQMGNSRARAVYEANLPDNFRRPQNDTALETFVRAKYEQKKYIAREWVPPAVPKVNWEKEIDDEIERQKRQRKQTSVANNEKNKSTSGKQTENFTIPQIPKPKSSSGSASSKSNSPKPNRSSTENTQATVSDTKNVDLLGLDQNQQNGSQGEDAFSNFLSASLSSEKPVEATDNSKVQNEEENFFNQPAPTEKEKAKLTKDSILALYGNTPPQSASSMYQNQMGSFSTISNQVTNFPTGQNQPVSFQGQVTQMPSTGYQVHSMQMPVSNYQLPMGSFSSAQQGYQGIQGTVIAPQQQFPVAQNYSLPSYGTQVTNSSIFGPQNVQSQNGTNFSQQFNQFQPNSNVSSFQNTGNQFIGTQQYPQNFQQNVSNKQFGVQNMPNQFQNYGLPPQNGVMPNPFFTQQPSINVQQQFANMSMKNTTSKNTVVPPTAATANMWQ